MSSSQAICPWFILPFEGSSEPPEQGARTLQTTYRRQTDRRQTDERQHIANVNVSSRSLKMELSGKTVYDPVLKTTQLSAHAQNHASPERCRKSFTMIFLGDHVNRFKFWQSDSIQGNFQPYFHCACAGTPTYELPVKVLTSPFDSLIPISLQGTLFRRYEGL